MPTDTNNSNPSPDNFDDIENNADLERKESLYPKKDDGSVDIDNLSNEQAGEYWKDRHDASTKGFHKYKTKTDLEIGELRSHPAPTKIDVQDAANAADTIEDFEKQFANFDELDDDTQNTLRTIFNTNIKNTHKILNSEPSLIYAREVYNEKKWDDAFNEVISNEAFKNLVDRKKEFKAEFFQKNNVPDNISSILTQLAKSYLFDNVKAQGVAEGKEISQKMNLLKASGGDKNENISSRSLEEWESLRQSNPQKFASMSKEYKMQRDRGDFTQ